MTLKHPRLWGPSRPVIRWPDVDVRAVVTDVDGCMTDGRVHYTGDGQPLRSFNTKDGIGHDALRKSGIRVAWLTSGKLAESTRIRSETIGVDALDIGSGNKGPRLESLCEQLGVRPSEVVYLGDDLPDIPAMEIAGVAVCPADAIVAVRRIADIILPVDGGDGCFRFLAELVLAAQGQIRPH